MAKTTPKGLKGGMHGQPVLAWGGFNHLQKPLRGWPNQSQGPLGVVRSPPNSKTDVAKNIFKGLGVARQPLFGLGVVSPPPTAVIEVAKPPRRPLGVVLATPFCYLGVALGVVRPLLYLP